MKRSPLLLCCIVLICFLLSACGSFLVPAGDPVLSDQILFDKAGESPVWEHKEELDDPAAIRELKLVVPAEETMIHFDTLGRMAQTFSDLSVVVIPAEAVGGQEALLASGLSGFDLLLADVSLLSDSVPEMAGSAEPFRFRDLTEARAYMESGEQSAAEERLKDYGLRVLGHTDNGFRVLSNSSRPIVKPGDLSGLRIRVSESTVFSQLLRELGAEAVEMPLENLYPGLQTGAVDGQESFLFLMENLRLWEVQGYLSVTNHVYGGMCLLIREESWNTLPAQTQEALSAAAEQILEEDRKLVEAELKRILAELEGRGVEVLRPVLF